MEKLYLIRHGLTAYNAEKRYCGSSDVSVTEEEKERLRILRCPLANRAEIITSGLRRCSETAEALFGSMPYRIDRRFRELDFGIFEGHTYDELCSTPEYRRWCASDGRIAPPGGESSAEFAKRVDEGLNELLSADGCFILITHGGVIAHIMQRLFPAENRNRYQWQPEHGGGYLLTESAYTVLCFDKKGEV